VERAFTRDVGDSTVVGLHHIHADVTVASLNSRTNSKRDDLMVDRSHSDLAVICFRLVLLSRFSACSMYGREKKLW
jgi:hypothetical protein